MYGMKRMLTATVLVAAAANAGAEIVYTFESVTRVDYPPSGSATITGILVNNTSPSVVALPAFQGDIVRTRCPNLFETMLLHQGTYLLHVATDYQYPADEPPMGPYVVRCSLELKP